MNGGKDVPGLHGCVKKHFWPPHTEYISGFETYVTRACGTGHENYPLLAANISIRGQIEEMVMYKMLSIFLVALVITSPILDVINHYGISQEYILACLISLIATPWVVAQFDN